MVNVLLTYSELSGYTIDSNGWIPGTTTDDGRILVVTPKTLEFNLRDKKIIWLVEEFVLNPITNKWVLTDNNKFNKINGVSTITVSNDDLVDATTGLPTDASNPNAIGEFDYYVGALGKPAIYPALQSTITRRYV